MWNSKSWSGCYRGLFLLVRVRSGQFRLTLPLALFLIDETFDIIADLLWLVEKVIPTGLSRRYSYYYPESKRPDIEKAMAPGMSTRAILELSRELFNELRRYGRYSLVEVESGAGSHKQRVSVELF